MFFFSVWVADNMHFLMRIEDGVDPSGPRFDENVVSCLGNSRWTITSSAKVQANALFLI